jgi:hypothetical protein
VKPFLPEQYNVPKDARPINGDSGGLVAHLKATKGAI